MNTAGDVRTEDAFNVKALDAWLRLALDDADLGDGLPVVGQFAGGASNLTFELAYPDADLILRMPPHGTKAASAHNMHREFEIQRLLKPAFRYVPQVVAYSPAEASPIGAEFYVMERVEGLILRTDLPPDVQRALEEQPTGASVLADSLFGLLAQLHSVDVEAAGLGGFYRGPGYVARQVQGWSDRYRKARTEDSPDGDDVMEWLAQRLPQDAGVCLIHGDWRFDNLVLDPGSLAPVAALDWEMATVGDPLMDLGAALAYWVQADDDDFFQGFRRQPSNALGMPGREEIFARYLTATGRADADWTFYEIYGLFRLAVIAQQIWYRYSSGQTTNPAFRQFGPAVDYLMWRCRDRLN